MSEKQGVMGDIFAQRVKLAYRTTTRDVTRFCTATCVNKVQAICIIGKMGQTVDSRGTARHTYRDSIL